jgi:RNA polymerase sigma factor (TIGR02999 family)
MGPFQAANDPRMSNELNPEAIPVPPPPVEGVDVEALFPLLYQELRRLARSRLSQGGRHTYLDTNVLVHESYLRIQAAKGAPIVSKEHFLAYAATTMRSVIVDFVRRRNAESRGGDAEHITLDTEAGETLGASDEEILEVHDALEKLARVDARLVKVVEMRYFAGLGDEEIAASLGVSVRTVGRDWERARLLLAEMLKPRD